MKKLLLCVATIGLLSVHAESAKAQSPATVNTTINLQIPELLFIDVTSSALSLPTPDFAELDVNYTGTASHAVRHRGNVAHTITVAPATGVTIWNGPAGSSKAAGDLEWSTASGAWNAVTDAVNVGTGVKGGFGLNADIPVSWRSYVDYDEPSGNYSIVVTYTATAN
jgi:hypothetical protein